jgi:hypothetical protein
MRRIALAGTTLAVALAVVLAVMALGLRAGDNAHAIPAGTVDLVAIDMDTTGNDDATVGTIENCGAMEVTVDGVDNDGDTLIDEADSLDFDLVVKGVDVADRLGGYGFDVDYNPGVISVTGVVDVDGGGSVAPNDVTMVSRTAAFGGPGFLALSDWWTAPTSMTLGAGDGTANAPAGAFPAMHEPASCTDGIDDDGDTVADNAGECSPDGVLARVSLAPVAPGISNLTMPSIVGGADGAVDTTVADQNGAAIPTITSLQSAVVYVDQPCPVATDAKVTAVTTAAPGGASVTVPFNVTANVTLHNNGGLAGVLVDTSIALNLPPDSPRAAPTRRSWPPRHFRCP